MNYGYNHTVLFRYWYSDIFCSNSIRNESMECNVSTPDCSNSDYLRYHAPIGDDFNLFWAVWIWVIVSGIFCICLLVCCWKRGRIKLMLGLNPRRPVNTTSQTPSKPITTTTTTTTTATVTPQTQMVATTQYVPQNQYVQNQQYVPQPQVQYYPKQPQYVPQQPGQVMPYGYMQQPVYNNNINQPGSNSYLYNNNNNQPISDYTIIFTPQPQYNNTEPNAPGEDNNTELSALDEEGGNEQEGANNVTLS